MPTARALTVSPSMLCGGGGVCFWGGCLPLEGSVCLLWGVSACEGGVSAPRGVCSRGGGVASQYADTPLWTDRHL